MTLRRRKAPTRAEAHRLAQLASLLEQQRGHLRCVGYRQAEEDCDRLAALLLAEIGPRELARSVFRPIPRGGLIVLGMLSYLLDLPARNLEAQEPLTGSLVLVDDSALTGGRLAAAFAKTSAHRISVALLYAPAALRRSVEELEPRVERCLAAHDLVDRTEEIPYEERRVWQQRWRERLGPDRYFYGPTEAVAFAWTEPDRPLWNRDTGQLEPGWCLASHGRCLRHRGTLGPPPRKPPIARWQVASRVAHSDAGERVLLCQTERGDVLALEGTAAQIWRRLARHGDPAMAAAEVAELYATEAAEVARDVVGLASDLVRRGFLEPIDDAAV